MIHQRPADGHKGTFGHAMIVAGKYGMAGASVLAVRACLRAGVGKVTAHIPLLNNDILQISVPEAILEHDQDQRLFTVPSALAGIQALAIGPGIGTDSLTAEALGLQLSLAQSLPMVIDADALNILSCHADWLELLTENTILTPHEGELSRLLHASGCADDRSFVGRYHCHLVHKGHPTVVLHPDGTSYLCPYGNDGMATAGSGDVLTGIIVSLLAQGYHCAEASELGVCLHALAGDAAAKDLGTHSLIASDLIEYLPHAFRSCPQER